MITLLLILLLFNFDSNIASAPQNIVCNDRMFNFVEN